MIKTTAAAPGEKCEHIEMTPEEEKEFLDFQCEGAKRQKIADVQFQIDLLNAQQTPDRIREFVLGIDKGWLVNLNNEINSLQKSLKDI